MNPVLVVGSLDTELGLYKPGLGGIRLEDDVVVRATGSETLSTLALELVEVSA